MRESWNDYEILHEQSNLDVNLSLWALGSKVEDINTHVSSSVEELPPLTTKQKLTKKVFWSNEENAQKALQNEKSKWRTFTPQQEKTFLTRYKEEHPFEERINSAVDLLESSIPRIQTNLPWLSTYIDQAELLAIMSKESNLDPSATWKAWESGYFHLMPDRIRLTKKFLADMKVDLPATNESFSSCVLWIVSFLTYKQESLKRFSAIKQPKLAQREKNRLVWLAHNKWIETTEKVVSLAYVKYADILKNDKQAKWKFEYVYQILYEMAWFNSEKYQPRSNMKKQPSYQFLKLQVVDYGTVEQTATTPLSNSYPLSPYRASVGLRYMLTIEALTDQLK